MTPNNNKYINSLDGSKLTMILSTTDSGGTDTNLAATEDTMIRAKTADQIIMLEKCFIRSFLTCILISFDQILISEPKDVYSNINATTTKQT